MKKLNKHYVDEFLKKLNSNTENVKRAILEAKHFLPFEKVDKLFSIKRVIDKKEYFYAETTFDHKIFSVVSSKKENFRMNFLIIHPKVEGKILEADSFKSFVVKRFEQYPEIKKGYKGAYTMKDMETGKVITDKLTTKPFTVMMATSYTELNRSQKVLLGTLSKFVMLSYQEESNLEKANSIKTKEVKKWKSNNHGSKNKPA